LKGKYTHLYVRDDYEGDDDDGGGGGGGGDGGEQTTVIRKIDTVTWKTGKGNSYVVNAFDVGPDGKLDRTKLTEYKIDDSLISLIKSATEAGNNAGITFIDDAVPAMAAPAAIAAPAAAAAGGGEADVAPAQAPVDAGEQAEIDQGED